MKAPTRAGSTAFSNLPSILKVEPPTTAPAVRPETLSASGRLLNTVERAMIGLPTSRVSLSQVVMMRGPAFGYSYQTTLCVFPLETLTKPSGASGDGATSTQRQGAQVSVAKASRSGKPAHQRGE